MDFPIGLSTSTKDSQEFNQCTIQPTLSTPVNIKALPEMASDAVLGTVPFVCLFVEGNPMSFEPTF